jgi:aldose 1-epimerase
MATDSHTEVRDDALRSFAPGELVHIARGTLHVDVAPAAGGRIAQIRYEGQDWLAGYSDCNAAMIAWGCYPMLPWAGRIRRGQFAFGGAKYQLPSNLGAHAIHGVGFALPWEINALVADRISMSLQLPADERWPFAGIARQTIEVHDGALDLCLSVQSQHDAMPRPVIGWHPWFLKPERMDFQPKGFYRRDAEGIAVRPVVTPTEGPWDDCFVNDRPVVLHRGNRLLRLTSDCDHWVVYDETAHATCIEPQTGPPDAFNLEPGTLSPGDSVDAWFRMEWA